MYEKGVGSRLGDPRPLRCFFEARLNGGWNFKKDFVMIVLMMLLKYHDSLDAKLSMVFPCSNTKSKALLFSVDTDALATKAGIVTSVEKHSRALARYQPASLFNLVSMHPCCLIWVIRINNLAAKDSARNSDDVDIALEYLLNYTFSN